MTRSLGREQVFRIFSPEMSEIVGALVAESVRRNFRLFLVGGPVRDLLLGRPVGDIDLLLEAPALSLKGVGDVARAALPASVKVVEHGRFGTVRLEAGHAKLDVALARRETYRAVGALPTVEPATLEEDLLRRDFSVNALALDLSTKSAAARMKLVDPMGGLEDLARRQLRILHAKSFHDDPTRALRAARIGPRLGFGLERGTRSVLRRALEEDVLSAVSGDRIRREIDKVFTDSRYGLDPVAALRRMSQWGLLGALDSGLVVPSSAVLPLRRLGKAVARPPWRSSRFRPFHSGLAIWLAELPPAVRQRTLRRLSVRGEAAERVMGFARFRHQKLAALTRARGRGAVDGLLMGIHEESLHALYAAATPPMRKQIFRWAAEDRQEKIPLTGADLVALGLEGAALGEVLARLRAGFLDNELVNREEALTLAQELLRRPVRKASGRQKSSARRSSDE